MMELLNAINKYQTAAIKVDTALLRDVTEDLLRLMAPFAPHFCEESWHQLGYTDTIFHQTWPTFDPAALVRDTIEIAVQTNGAVKFRLDVPTDAEQTQVEAIVMADERTNALLTGKQLVKFIYVKGRPREPRRPLIQSADVISRSVHHRNPDRDTGFPPAQSADAMELRMVFLLPAALFALLIPLWMGTYWPELIWTEDRHLLMTLQVVARALFLLFCLVNLYYTLLAVDWPGLWQALRAYRVKPIRPVFGARIEYHVRQLRRFHERRKFHRQQRIPLGKRLKDSAKIMLVNVIAGCRELPGALLRLIIHLYQRLLRSSLVHPRHVLAADQDLPVISRHANRLRLTGLVLAIFGLTGQLLVLLNNQGYWPLAEAYLKHLSDPLLIQGIRNGALRLSRLIDDQTSWAWLGQTIPWPSFDSHAPARVTYISVTDLILSLSLFLTTLSLFPPRKDQ